jgi:hypothetical protein
MEDIDDWDNGWMNSLSCADMIVPGLFLGPIGSCDPAALESLGITHILRVIIGDFNKPPSHV